MNEQAKGSTMYERFSAVAELNRASGFDPLRFARRAVQDGCERLLLDLKYKKLWFRLRYPQGRIKITPLKITEQLAIIEAKVFFDRGDTVPAASYIAQRYAKDTPGGLYIESAQHMAVDTALNDAGFGVQLMNAAEEQPAQAKAIKDTAPVALPIAPTQAALEAAPPIAARTVAPAAQEQRLPEETAPAPVEELPVTPADSIAMNEAIVPQQPSPAEESPETAAPAMEDVTPPPLAPAAANEQPPAVEQAPVEQAPAAEELPQTPTLEVAPAEAAQAAADDDTGDARYTADMSVEEICSLMTLEDAQNILVDVGTCKGWTLQQVAERRTASLKWYLNGYQGDNNLLRAGARLLLESIAMDKAS
ncbi:hypothetical protein [Sporomusa sphaeroides]|uniref:hypothetical protein n=1 Tax=Sporomusa sphaeroides TaxID=47679 RepID=UPI002C02147D|nr:hypothetical protein [Sporomusa sphaeroides]HML34022.1 hypothetical protein [Sporomusa sphaeroides]